MTDPTLPPMPSAPPPPPAPQKSRTNAVIIGAAAAVIAAVIGTGIVVVQSSDHDDSKPAAATKSSAPAAEAADDDTAEAVDTEPAYIDLDADSFSIDLKTKSRQCFGSAGCTLTVEPDLTLDVDTDSVDPDAVYEITYEIRGDESGPIIATAELTNQTSLNYTPSIISTPSSATKVSVKITDVSNQGV